MKKAGMVAFLALAGCGMIGRGGGEKPQAAERPQQELTPIRQIDTWLNGMHVAKDDADHVSEHQHYCDTVNEDLIQCALYDRTGPRAHLVGVEYVLSEAAFERLPEAEREYWHPHNYEVLSGMLVAPGVPKEQEDALMRRMLNSYGKTWHTWPMAQRGGGTAELPTGEPELLWSFNADGEAPTALTEARARRLELNMEDIRERRQDLVKDANPQYGVNAMADEFPNRKPIKGVQEVYLATRQQPCGTKGVGLGGGGGGPPPQRPPS
ncbi:MAG: DUF1264 domain-containing protein [Myxococcota bacterium]